LKATAGNLNDPARRHGTHLTSETGGRSAEQFREVWTEEFEDGLPDEALHRMLETRPDSAALVTSGTVAA
jgi:hypothetical protein